jgi:hypothetical protein
VRFYLGSHMPNWLELTDVPLFVSHRRLSGRKGLPRAAGRWALDSGGFSELSMYGGWRTLEAEYVSAVRRYDDEIGHLDWVAPQDWMCEPHILQLTGLTVAEHQKRTVFSFLSLRQQLGMLVIPVVQGWRSDDYLRCVDLYDAHGVDLTTEPVVGVGSVCRRQSGDEAAGIISQIVSLGIACHGFGFKKDGLEKVGRFLASADSMAWSFNARRNPPLPGCTHKSCANCLRWALKWRDELLAQQWAPFLQGELSWN